MLEIGPPPDFRFAVARTSQSPFPLAVTLLTTLQTLNRQTNERTTSQRFGKIKRGATPPTSQRTVAPHLLLPQPHKDEY